MVAAGGLAIVATLHGTPARVGGLALAGAGLGAFTPVNNATVMAAGPRELAGVLGGLVNMTRTLRAILGVALASTFYASSAGATGVSHAVGRASAAHGLLVTLAVLAGLAATMGPRCWLSEQRRAAASLSGVSALLERPVSCRKLLYYKL